jgi:adenylyltransferase/sulfurtransferase
MKAPANFEKRYARQISLKGFGLEQQQKLMESSVLVIGAGGLGCATLAYLAGSGIGLIGIADGDQISLDNLHRQLLFNTADVGKYKAEIAKQQLQLLNPDIEINAYPVFISNKNALDIFEQYNLIIDGTDNFASRYLINDACLLLNKTLIFGAVSQYEGQIAVLNARNSDKSRSVNYRDIFPKPPSESEVLNCEEGGVLGPLAGIIGTMQAIEAIKQITGVGKSLVNQMMIYNLLNNDWLTIELIKHPQAANFIPADASAFMNTNYKLLCSQEKNIQQIDVEDFNSMLNQGQIDVIDVREPGEDPVITVFDYLSCPLAQISEIDLKDFKDDIVIFCNSGSRSLAAAIFLKGKNHPNKNIYSLQSGIIKWLEHNQSKNH